MKRNDIDVANFLQYANFVINSPETLYIMYFVFVHDFDCKNLVIVWVRAVPYVGKLALAKEVANSISTDSVLRLKN